MNLLLVIGLSICAFLLGMGIQYTISERRLPTAASLATLPALQDLQAITTTVGVIFIVITVLIRIKAHENATSIESLGFSSMAELMPCSQGRFLFVVKKQ